MTQTNAQATTTAPAEHTKVRLIKSVTKILRMINIESMTIYMNNKQGELSYVNTQEKTMDADVSLKKVRDKIINKVTLSYLNT
jgi:hypothetical protein